MEPAPLLTDLGHIPDGGHAAYLLTEDATRIRVGWWGEKSGGTALLLPGRTEYIEKYGRMIDRLLARNLNVVALDWRGQGLSDRPDNRLDIGHVDRFTDYQLDLGAALSLPAIQDLATPYLIFAHSMGGTIGLRALSQGLDAKAAVFSSPMWGLKHADLLRPIFAPATLVARPFNKHKTLFPGTKPTFYVQVEAFENNTITNDQTHWQMMVDHLNAHNELGLGGPTLHWASEAAKELAKLRKLPVPNIPILALRAENELVVDPVAIDKRVATIPSARLETIAGAKHEIWMETDSIQSRVWSLTDAFLSDLE